MNYAPFMNYMQVLRISIDYTVYSLDSSEILSDGGSTPEFITEIVLI